MFRGSWAPELISKDSGPRRMSVPTSLGVAQSVAVPGPAQRAGVAPCLLEAPPARPAAPCARGPARARLSPRCCASAWGTMSSQHSSVPGVSSDSGKTGGRGVSPGLQGPEARPCPAPAAWLGGGSLQEKVRILGRGHLGTQVPPGPRTSVLVRRERRDPQGEERARSGGPSASSVWRRGLSVHLIVCRQSAHRDDCP